MKINKNIFLTKLFYWSGLTKHGNKISGEIHAINIHSARFTLIKEGITIKSIHKKPFFYFHFLSKKNIAQDIVLFFRQLSTLVTAGIPLLHSITVLHQSHANPTFQKMLSLLKADIEAGKNLALSLQSFPRYFDHFTCHLVHMGEQTGTIGDILIRIATHKEKMIHFRGKIKQALFYPAVISIVAFMITCIMLLVIVPRFAELFENMKESLPFITLFMIGVSQILRHYGGIIILSSCISLFLLHFYAVHSSHFKATFEKIVLTLPILKNGFQKLLLIHFIRTLSTSLAAGIPIIDILKIMAHSIKTNTYMLALQQLHSEIAKGQPLHQAMQKHVLFPFLLIQMVKIGEESGTLEHMLEKVADLYDNDIDVLTNRLSQLLEPLIMIILGVLIGGLVIAMYLPIFMLGNKL